MSLRLRLLTWCAAIGLMLAAEYHAPAAAIQLTSPTGQLRATLATAQEGRLTWSVQRAGVVVIEPSPRGITIDGQDLGAGVLEPSGIGGHHRGFWCQASSAFGQA